MQLYWLADVLRARGLDVVEYDGWKTRTARSFDSYTPVGIINHHTAGYFYLQHYPDGHWPDSSLAYKCNVTIRPNGEVHVLNAGWAYDSGNGSSKVLDAVRNDRPLPALGSLTSDTGGNRWFIDIEVQHLGHGGYIEPAQRAALIGCNAAICERMGWDPRYRVIGHREWAPDRKIDPRWDGVSNPMPGIRQDTLDLLEDDMPAPKDWTAEDWKAFRENTAGNVWGGDGYTIPDPVSGKALHPNTILRGIRSDSRAARLVAQGLEDVDEAEVAQLVLAGLTVGDIADALGAELGRDVADEIDRRARERLG